MTDSTTLDEMFTTRCLLCSLPVGHVAGDAPESAPERTSAADAPPDDAEAQRGAASGSQPPEHDPLGPWYRATCRVAVEH